MINVAVTGSTGFVGSRLLLKNSKDLVFHKLDLREPESEMPDKIDHLIHLAGRTFVPESWEKPQAFYEANVMGTQAALDFCRHRSCGMTYVSSYIYGVPLHLPIDESHPASPNSPYNHSKLLGEELCNFYYKYFNVNTAIIRPFNLYGPSQKDVFLIPTIIKHLQQSDKISVQSLKPKRDYLFVDDFIELLVATISFKGCETFNAGYGTSYSVAEIIEILKTIAGKSDMPVLSSEVSRSNEVMDIVADTSKAYNSFNWTPKTSFKEGLAKVMDEIIKQGA